MSGITGLLRHSESEVDEAGLDRMLESLEHRGPDGRGQWRRGPVGLGHQLMETTPEEAFAELPCERDGLVITADCRLDNRAELLSELAVPGPHSEVPDSHLILEAYREWGTACPERLLGAFAFAIWDAEEKRLFAARDHVGVKPFFYYSGDDVFTFGSEIKALLTVAEVPERLNELRVGDYLGAITEDPKSTFYEEIYRLPPAHRLEVSADGVEREQYWKLDPDRELQFEDEDEYFARFRELFYDAVRCRLRSKGRIGTYLSGGLDSSSVTCVTRELLNRDEVETLPTFSWVFDQVPESDEREYIQAVHEQGEFDPHCVKGGELSPFGDIDEMYQYHDQPFFANQHFLTWALFRHADNQNVRVILGGYGGDMTLSHSNGFHAELFKQGKLLTLLKEIEGVARRREMSRREVVWRYVIAPLAPDIARMGWRYVLGSEVGDGVNRLNPILDAEFADDYELVSRATEYGTIGDGPPANQQSHHHDLLTSPLTSLSAETTDISGSAFNIEERYPFLDRRLIEFCLALPADIKMRNGWARYPLRKAMDGILPEVVRWRTDKGDLAPNFYYTLRERDAPFLNDHLQTDRLLAGSYLDTEILHRRLSLFFSGHDDDVMTEIWFPALLEFWLRHNPHLLNSKT